MFSSVQQGWKDRRSLDPKVSFVFSESFLAKGLAAQCERYYALFRILTMLLSGTIGVCIVL